MCLSVCVSVFFLSFFDWKVGQLTGWTVLRSKRELRQQSQRHSSFSSLSALSDVTVRCSVSWQRPTTVAVLAADDISWRTAVVVGHS